MKCDSGLSLWLPQLALSLLCSAAFAVPQTAWAQDIVDTAETADYAGDNFNQLLLKTYLYNEAAYRNQVIQIRRSTEDNRLKLGEVLNEIINFDEKDVLSMTMMFREADGDTQANTDDAKEQAEIPTETKQFDNAADILDYDVFSSILRRKTKNGTHYTQGMYHETVLAIRLRRSNIILTLTSLGGTETDKYIRATMIIPDGGSTDDSRTIKSECKATSISFVLAHLESGESQFATQFEEIAKSTNEKIAADIGLNEFEQEYIKGKFEFEGNSYIGYGEWLYKQKRYYDAYTMLHRAYNYLHAQLPQDAPETVSNYYRVCDDLYDCLSKMGRQTEADYYFKLGTFSNTLDVVGRDFTTRLEVKPTPTIGDAITIDDALRTTMHLEAKNLAPFMFVYDNAQGTMLAPIESLEEILNYPLDKPSACNKTFVVSTNHVHYKSNDRTDESILCDHAPLVITTHEARNPDGESIVRVDIVQCNFALNDTKQEFSKYNIPVSKSFALGLKSDNTFNTGSLDDFERALEYADELSLSFRTLEAYKVSNWVFENLYSMTKGQTTNDDRATNLLYAASYRTGYVLQELEELESATYYLELAAKSNYAVFIQEYINCVVNSGNPIALDVIDEVSQRIVKPKKRADIKEWKELKAFLNRRKAYTLIELGRYDEAKALLHEMLKDPYCKEMAEGELQYIESLSK